MTSILYKLHTVLSTKLKYIAWKFSFHRVSIYDLQFLTLRDFVFSQEIGRPQEPKYITAYLLPVRRGLLTENPSSRFIKW